MELKKELFGVYEAIFAVLHSTCEEALAKTQLVKALDSLAHFYHFVDYEFDPKDYPKAPPNNDAKTRELVAHRFPSFGFYNVAESISDQVGESSCHIGDAVDDLTDILNDLARVIWLADNTSLNNALFHFECGYKTHWGLHLRQLQLYLHDMIAP